jgi:DedD protein
MDKQKPLWIIISVGIFLAAVLGIGLWWFYPRTDTTADEGAAADRDRAGETVFDPYEYVRKQPDDIIGLETPEEETDDDGMIIIYGEREEEEPSGLGEREEIGSAVSSEKDAVRREEPVSVTADSGSKDRGGEDVRPGSSEKESSSEKTEVSRAAPEKTAPAPQPVKIKVEEFWIQAGAYTNRDRLQIAQGRLSEQGLGTRITTKTVNNTTYYRLRIGPYEKKAEAEKFLAWVQDLEGFGDSYISVVYVTRTVMR